MSDSLNVHVIITKHLCPRSRGRVRLEMARGAALRGRRGAERPVRGRCLSVAPCPGLGFWVPRCQVLGNYRVARPACPPPHHSPEANGGRGNPKFAGSPAGTLHHCACRGGAVGHSAHAVGVFKRRCLNLKNQSKRSSFPPKVTYYLTQLNAVLEAGWRACVCCLDPASTIPDPAGRGSQPLARPGHTRGHGLCAP